MELLAGALATGSIKFGGVGTLQIDQTITGQQVFATPLAHIMAGDVIDLTGLTFVAGHTPLVSGSHLTISNGTASEQFTLQTPQTTNFSEASDGYGGTLVTALSAHHAVPLVGVSDSGHP